uniref:PH domain-containing protein n=1 Tax=Schistocephalus solidus TaxID=70667 RepID=A0A0X3NGR4_SCHSO
MVQIADPPLSSGWLYKWTNYLKGYKKRWFVLENGLFSYYKSSDAVVHSCMGTINLADVSIISKSSSTSFLLREFRGRSYHLKALNVQDKKKWLENLRMAKSKATKQSSCIESDGYSDDYGHFRRRSLDTARIPESTSKTSGGFCQESVIPGWRYLRGFRCRGRPDAQGDTESFISSASPTNMEGNSTLKTKRSASQASAITPSATAAQNSPAETEAGLNVSNNNRQSCEESQGDGDFLLKTPAFHFPRHRYYTMRHEVTNENIALNEFRGHVVAVENAFDAMVIEAERLFSGISCYLLSKQTENGEKSKEEKPGDVSVTDEQPHTLVSISRDGLATLQSSVEALVKTSQKAMAAWSTSTDWFQRRLSAETSRCAQLDLTVEQLAKQHRALELKLFSSYGSLQSAAPEQGLSRSISKGFPADTISSIDDVFFDAQSSTSASVLQRTATTPSLTAGMARDTLPPSSASLPSLLNADESSGSDDDLESAAREADIFLDTMSPLSSPTFDGSDKEEDLVDFMHPTTESASPITVPARKRRTSIPPRPRISLNLWNILKNCLGRELSRIPLPVNFNEPLSFLQRVTEDLTYSHCLDKAAQVPTENVVERMAWIAAFSVSCYATTAFRTCKPFNPLLGETYECDRSDDEFGWRSFAEQVSHHPPVVAHYCESTRHGWKFWQEFTVNSKFRGKYLSLVPVGSTHLVFSDGHHYTWSKVTITVHNIIVGRLWIENHGETVIQNHSTQHFCRMQYESRSYFSRDADRRVTGIVKDADGTPKFKIEGVWNSNVRGFPLNADGSPADSPMTLWSVAPLPPNAEEMYNFTKLAIELNEPEDGVAPTDSRLRPDQRLMEEGLWDEANTEKERLEAKQRLKRKIWEEAEASGTTNFNPSIGPPYKPVWFSPIFDKYTNENCHVFTDEYWQAKAKQDWSRCPDIY